MFVKDNLIYLTPDETSKLKQVGMQSYQSYPDGIVTVITAKSFMQSGVGEIELSTRSASWMTPEPCDGHYGYVLTFKMPVAMDERELIAEPVFPNITSNEQAKCILELMVVTQMAANINILNGW